MGAHDAQLSIDRYSGHPDAQHTFSFYDALAKRSTTTGSTITGCNADVDAEKCAAALAKGHADMVVFAVVGNAESESRDRATIGLRSDQQSLVEAAARALPSAQKVVVVVSGGAISTEKVDSLVNATVWSGKAGMQAGSALASLLYGDVEFSGRLSTTIYKEAWVDYSDFMDNG